MCRPNSLRRRQINERTIKDNSRRSRFELDVEGQIAFLDYRRQDGTLILTHVEVPVALRNRGIGSAFVKQVLDQAREQGWKIVPVCPFIRAYLWQHPEYEDLLPGK